MNAGEPRPKSATVQWLTLGLGIATISALHYLTDPHYAIWHGVYQRLYYAPIIVAAYWFGVRGGLLAALATSLAYVPHIYTAWADNPAYARSQYIEAAMFYVAGLLVGGLSERQQRLTSRYRRAAESLERALRDLRESQEHLRRAERLSVLGQIAAGLAHEIRNPLAGLKGALEIIASRVAADSPEAEFAGIAARDAARLEGLVSDFLTFARPRDPELQDVDLYTVIEHVATMIEPQADRADVRVAVERPDASIPARVDREQMAQVLLNVILNAVQSSRPGGTVRVQVRAGEGCAVVDVIDEGSGIPAESLPRIFDPFFTTRPRGTGLGLAISHRIVLAHGGTIDVAASSGEGTTFRVQLPLAPAAPPPPAAAAPPSSSRT